jgi:hypothetical protein
MPIKQGFVLVSVRKLEVYLTVFATNLEPARPLVSRAFQLRCPSSLQLDASVVLSLMCKRWRGGDWASGSILVSA